MCHLPEKPCIILVLEELGPKKRGAVRSTFSYISGRKDTPGSSTWAGNRGEFEYDTRTTSGNSCRTRT